MVVNGKKLYSDIDTIDSAYKKIIGKTKLQCDKEAQKEHEKYEARRKAHKEAIPELTKGYMEKGRKILDKKYIELWDKIIPVRLSDLYEGMELGNSLEIITELNKGCDLSVAKEIIIKQGHSGMSFSLVCAMVEALCDRGIEFVAYVK